VAVAPSPQLVGAMTPLPMWPGSRSEFAVAVFGAGPDLGDS